MPDLPERLPPAPPGGVVRLIFASPGARMEMVRKLADARGGMRPIF